MPVPGKKHPASSRNSAPTPAEPGSSSLSAQVNSAPPVAAQGNLIPHAAVQVIPPPPTPVNLATPAVATVNPAPLAQVNLAPSTVNPPLPAQANHLPPTPTQVHLASQPLSARGYSSRACGERTFPDDLHYVHSGCRPVSSTLAIGPGGGGAARTLPSLMRLPSLGMSQMQPEFIQCLKEQYAREHGVAIVCRAWDYQHIQLSDDNRSRR